MGGAHPYDVGALEDAAANAGKAGKAEEGNAEDVEG